MIKIVKNEENSEKTGKIMENKKKNMENDKNCEKRGKLSDITEIICIFFSK